MSKGGSQGFYYLLLIIYYFLFFSPLTAFTQISPSKYFIAFSDKNNTPYSLSNPSAFLSAKAMIRRSAHNIPYVQNDLPVNPQYVDSVARKGVTVLTRSKWFNGVSIQITDSAQLNAVLALPFVLSSKPVQLRRINNNKTVNIYKNEVLPVESHEAMRTAQTFDYGPSYNQIGMMHLDSLHAQGYHGEGMTIALLDDGFFMADSLPAFDSLRVNNQILGMCDFVNPGTTGNLFNDTVYSYFNVLHGMTTLSVLGGNLPGQLVGAASKANFFLLRTEQAATENIIEEYNWDAGAEYADSAGADIFSTSLGYTTFDEIKVNDSTFIPNPADHSYSSMDGKTCPITIAAEIAASKGILVVNSAGNEGDTGWQYISAPADGDSVLTIGAVDSSGNYAAFSGKGPTYDGRLKPNVVAQGVSDVIASPVGGITTGSGTSYSCPLVAGAAACLWQKFPNSSNMEIFKAIEQSASQYNHPDTLLGYGIPNFYLADLLLSGFILHPDQLIFLYPNPANSTVIVSLKRPAIQGTLQVINMLGEIVMTRIVSASETIFQVDVNMLSRGMYILQIISEEGIVESKMVKL